ncbi:MAG: tRNA (adenosine(37)-N6)-threonylcarbamoyltransferase complex ATPase subunit type 1 TsaE [Flavobacteriaceae bacterium CG_4_8_14_3_um_filter_34_10]|nr:MAG: tRNA (adenosine(37)-N6)-threonylcarbamoyltransferase complex ATPase subunit type 1 TsaE [Flavobacteriaceae bacterium CG2_30_34_30]PIX09759.1 MAG: tRNA (adenosine(37)-N6)-threonylcarbamoyltransferase complex ATPase subunit type 1 TsaE [Flavobacteriaceae bacterium CG_4_8_14_3_um_filter_34_10]
MNYTYSISSLPQAADAVLATLTSKTILFYGEMGSGKTTLIKEIVKKLGYNALVSSPTFSLVNEYQGEKEKMYHFDFYRIEKEEEALDMGIEEYLNSDYWNFIEWPENILNLVPAEKNEIFITINNNGTRTLNLNANG